jgi:predicted O-methyltransferase YrrM
VTPEVAASAAFMRPRDLLAAIVAAVAAVAAGWWWLPLGLGVSVILIVGIGLMCFRRLRVAQEEIVPALEASHRRHYRQTEALFSVFSMIRPRAPLPVLREWAVSPDFAVVLLTEIRARRPRVVVELGSGASTLLIGYALESLGEGCLISLEHDPVYARRTEELIAAHGLERLASVRLAPLVPVAIDGEVATWYAANGYAGLGPIDLLVVDGPPARLGRQMRYPAFPVLRSLLSPEASILLDDAGREDEATIVKRWQSLDPRLTSDYVRTEKGAYLLRRVP